jgi:DNA-binding GntR family transcriptional regulator
METAFGSTESLAPEAAHLSMHDVASRLREAIGSGQFQPRERLIEESLARAFGTNRAVIRNALVLLEQEQLIVRERNRGACVRAISPAEATQILEVRAVLEGLLARQAAPRIDEEGIATLRRLLDRMYELRDCEDLRGYLQCNADFHRTISEIAEHEATTKVLDALQSQSRRFQFRSVVYHGRLGDSLEEHERILAALVAHDGVAAEAAVRAHVEKVAETVSRTSNFEFMP